jgi:1-acyl-sn-glycerol-3-phosphate acyltransferase
VPATTLIHEVQIMLASKYGVRWRRLARSVWVSMVFATLGMAAWIGVMILPRMAVRRRWVRRCSRGALALTGVKLFVSGLEQIPRHCLLVSNHTSYLDVVVFTALLPDHLGYVAKRELASTPVIAPFLSRIGTAFIERFKARSSIVDLNTIKEVVREGESFVFFPEGTFVGPPGLLPFRMGAFLIAAETGTPVVPVALSGSRNVLPPGSWRLERGAVTVRIGVAIVPESHTRRHATELRDRARALILESCGEPCAHSALEAVAATSRE